MGGPASLLVDTPPLLKPACICLSHECFLARLHIVITMGSVIPVQGHREVVCLLHNVIHVMQKRTEGGGPF